MKPVRIGVVGAGDISTVYLNAISRSPALELRAIATRDSQAIAEKAAGLKARAVSVAALLADDAIELVVNLTPGVADEEINGAALEAGKHVYSEKPFALSHAAARRLADLAASRGLLIGSAPDTFCGSAHQAARKALDAGAIGRPVIGTSFLGLPGLELFHPSPEAFYRPGGEPPFDAGPYYTTMWINLLGPVRRVFSVSGAGKAERTILRGPRQGTVFPVTVDTSFNTVLEFEAASVSFIISLDVVVPTLRPGELFGSGGILAMADPMFFGGEPAVTAPPEPRRALATAEQGFATPNRHDHTGRVVADYRGAGLVDLALAIRTGSRHRTGVEFIDHSVEVMEAIVRSATTRAVIDLVSTCERPATIDPETDAALIAQTASPFDLAESASAH